MRGFRPEGERDLVLVPLKDKDRRIGNSFASVPRKCARLRRAWGRRAVLLAGIDPGRGCAPGAQAVLWQILCLNKWGLNWQITPRALIDAISDSDRAAAKRAFGAMMTMRKIDIAAIDAARRG